MATTIWIYFCLSSDRQEMTRSPGLLQNEKKWLILDLEDVYISESILHGINHLEIRYEKDERMFAPDIRTNVNFMGIKCLFKVVVPPYLNFFPSSIFFIFVTLIDNGVIHVMSKFQRNLT
jgi:hypothetical protein